MTAANSLKDHYPKRKSRLFRDFLLSVVGLAIFGYWAWLSWPSGDWSLWLSGFLTLMALISLVVTIYCSLPRFSGLHLYPNGFEFRLPGGFGHPWSEIQEIWLVQTGNSRKPKSIIKVLTVTAGKTKVMPSRMARAIKARDIMVAYIRGDAVTIFTSMAAGLLSARAQRALKLPDVPRLRVALTSAIRFIELHGGTQEHAGSDALLKRLEGHIALSDEALLAAAGLAAAPFFPTGAWDRLMAKFPEDAENEGLRIAEEIMQIVGNDTGD